MIHLSRLNHAQYRAYLDTLTVPHRSRVSGRLMTLEHDHVADLPLILGGSVDHKTEGHATSSAQVQVLDLDHGLGVDSPGLSGQARLDLLLRVEVGTHVPGVGWVQVPVHTGRVVRPHRGRSGALTLESHGKEVLADRPAWGQGRTWPKGTRKTDILRDLAHMWGEHSSRIDIPDWRERTAEEVGVGVGTSMWGRGQNLARSLGAHLFYDAWGIVRLRRYSNTPALTLTDWENRPRRKVPAVSVERLDAVFPGDDVFPDWGLYPVDWFETSPTVDAGLVDVGSYLLTEPEVAYRAYGTGYVNTVWVTGATSSGGKRPEFTAYAPSWHPMSPWRSQMRGRPDYRVERIDDDTIRTWADTERVARDRMDRLLLDFADVKCESLPIPGLEPEDTIAVSTTAGHMRLRLKEWSLPLDGGPMTIGTRSRVRTGRHR